MMVIGTQFILFGFIADKDGNAVTVATTREKTADGSRIIGEQRVVRVWGPWAKWGAIAQESSREMNRLEAKRLIAEGLAVAS